MRKALLLFGTLNDDDIDWMIDVGKKREVDPGAILIHQGSAIAEMFVVMDGVLLVRTDIGGGLDLARLRSGEIVGEMSFVDSRPTSASVHAVERSVVLSLSTRLLENKLGEDLAFAARFYRALAVLLSNRVRSTVNLLGYGHIEARPEEDNMPEDLDTLALAAARFDSLRRRLKAL